MKFPSIEDLGTQIMATVKRFPFEVLFALAATIAATCYIYSDDYLITESFYTKIEMTANLGLLLSLAATLFLESKPVKNRFVIKLAVAILAGCLIFIYNPQLRAIDGIRFFLLCLAFHLLVAFAAFTDIGHIQGFWQFNKALFLRFLASVLYSAVFYIGLAAAIAATRFLFNMHFHEKIYGILLVWISGIFNTLFFLTGVPADTLKLDEDATYPKGLKVFTQYVLIPLASVYVIILLAYEAKILVQWTLPKGLVSNLILGYAVFGILSILLIYPLRNTDGNKWIKTYSRSFYFLLIPLLVLLFTAVFTRLLPYGVTPQRYFLIVLALWLLFITIYFLLSRKQNIKIIPISLCIVSLLSGFGPQSAFSVSKYSQRNKLVGIFKKYGAYNNGKLTSVSKIKMSKKDGDEAVEKLSYFVYDNDLSGLQPAVDKDLNKVIDSLNGAKKTAMVKAYAKLDNTTLSEYELKGRELDWISSFLGVSRFRNYRYDYTNRSRYDFEVKDKGLITTKGSDYALMVRNYDSDNSTPDTGNAKINQAVEDSVYTVYLDNEHASFNVKQIADSLIKTSGKLKADSERTFTLRGRSLSFTKQTAHFKVTLQLTEINCSFDGDSGEINLMNVDGWYMITVK